MDVWVAMVTAKVETKAPSFRPVRGRKGEKGREKGKEGKKLYLFEQGKR